MDEELFEAIDGLYEVTRQAVAEIKSKADGSDLPWWRRVDIRTLAEVYRLKFDADMARVVTDASKEE